MPGLLRGVVRTAAIAGTATAVSNRVSRRQGGRWAQQNDAAAAAQPQAQPEPTAPAASAAPSMDDKIAQLKELAALKEQGVLTEAELAVQKDRILNS